MRAGPYVLILLGLLPAAVLGQEPAPSPSPSPAPPVASPEAPAAKPAEVPDEARAKGRGGRGGRGGGKADAAEAEQDPLAPGEIRIRAETQGMQQGHYEARGFVDLRSNEFRIQADKLDLFQKQEEGQPESRRIVAEGNVVFMKGEERLSGSKLELDLDTQKGFFENALGYVTPGVFVEGRRIERVDGDTYEIEGGSFTSCAQPTPRWSFSASRATLDVGDKITARNVVFRVKSVPAMYVPYFVYPIEEDQRSTGFLFPHFGYSQYRGFNVGSGFFWAMGRTADQTFYLDNYSKYGWGFGHELRYMLEAPSRGNFRSYFFRPKTGGTWDYDLDWTAAQNLPGEVKANVNVRQYSNTVFQQQIQEEFARRLQRSRVSSMSLQRSFRGTNVMLLADSMDTFYGTESRTVTRHLPTLRVTRSPKKIGGTGLVFGFEGRAENLARGNETVVESYSRFDLWPRLSRPLSVSFLQVTPEVQYRHTRYGAIDGGEGLPVPGRVDRSYLETSVEMRGPNFSRVFNTEGNFYSEKYKHVLGPEVVWTYRSRVDDFDQIYKFDGVDYFVGTNEVQYALVNRFYAKRPSGRADRLDTHEFLSWRLGQTYYVNINEDPGVYDPNYSSTNFGPEGEPTHVSPLQSRLRFTPTRGARVNFDLEYDVNFRAVRSLSLSTVLERPLFTVDLGWNRSNRLSANPEQQRANRNTLRGGASVQVLPNRLRLNGTADYDLVNRALLNTSATLRYDVQCCGFIAYAARTNVNSFEDTTFRFAIELANIGTIGNFNGEEVADRRRGFGGGYR